MRPEVTWRADVDALQFSADNGSVCLVHRLAFRTLLRRLPEPSDCLDYYRANVDQFIGAARCRLATDPSIGARSFHLNSRQIRRSVGLYLARERAGRLLDECTMPDRQ
jgi:hypothetical protein